MNVDAADLESVRRAIRAGGGSAARLKASPGSASRKVCVGRGFSYAEFLRALQAPSYRKFDGSALVKRAAGLVVASGKVKSEGAAWRLKPPKAGEVESQDFKEMLYP